MKTNAPYRYSIANGGYQIENSRRSLNRPLYGPHCRDLDSFDERVLALTGDTPETLMILLNWRVPGGGGCAGVKLGHLFLGIERDGLPTWFHQFSKITARYVPGHQEFEVFDEETSTAAELTLVRPVACEGLLVRVHTTDLPAGGRIAVCCGGATEFEKGLHYDYQWDAPSKKHFSPEDCRATHVRADGRYFTVRRPDASHDRTLTGIVATGDGPGGFGVQDADVVSGGMPPDDGSQRQERPDRPEHPELPVAYGTFAAERDRDFYFILTPDDPSDPGVARFVESPAETFGEALEHYRCVSETVTVETPDPYLDLGFKAQVAAMDGSWHAPCFTHGPWSWTTPYAGWRICYGPVTLGWFDRVRASTAEVFDGQRTEPEEPDLVWRRPGGFVGGHQCRGAVPDTARRDSFFYNMGEILVDHVLYLWEWSGDLDFMDRMFDPIAEKLRWEERLLDADGDGLYENWLNTWISDAHWYNGGGCIQASVYNWRANTIMADVARRLGKNVDEFTRRADKIREACRKHLWIPECGLYGEYAEAVGQPRLHRDPEQASIYHPIDFHFCDDFEAYQMLRYTEYAISNEVGTTPRGGRLVWSSNWDPVLYSSLGLYPQETINLLLCYYRVGLTEKADTLLKGLEASFFNGPCPGGLAHNQKPDGSHFGSTDFADTTSMFVRTVVEGLFGISIFEPDNRVSIQPTFPGAWDHARITGPLVAYEYAREDSRDRYSIHGNHPRRHTLRLSARLPQVQSVLVNGRPAEWRAEPGIGCAWIVVETDAIDRLECVVEYGGVDASPAGPHLSFATAVAPGTNLGVSIEGGTCAEVFDPQGVVEQHAVEARSVSARVGGTGGHHTFFVLVLSGNTSRWMPVDFEIRAAQEIVDPRMEVAGYRARIHFTVRNNADTELGPDWTVEAAGSRYFGSEAVGPHSDSARAVLSVSNPMELSPGSTPLLLAAYGGATVGRAGEAVDWLFWSRLKGLRDLLGEAVPIDLSAHVNAKLQELHEISYVSPRPDTYSIMVRENGRSEWDWNEWGHNVVKPDTGRIPADGWLVSDIGIPFRFATGVAGEQDCCVVSIWDQFPDEITIPIGRRGRKLYALLAVTTHPMQSRMENARLTCRTADGKRYERPLVNPEWLDDWLSLPYSEKAYAQYLGEKTHANIIDIPFDALEDVAEITVRCLSPEVIVALAGVTVLP